MCIIIIYIIGEVYGVLVSQGIVNDGTCYACDGTRDYSEFN